MIPIDKNIPIPPRKKKLTPNTYNTNTKKYDWYAMVVGDSFLIPYAEDRHITQQRANVGAMIAGRFNITGMKYTQRELEEGIRVWRIL